MLEVNPPEELELDELRWLSAMDRIDYCDYPAICEGTAAKDRAKGKKDRNPDVFAIFGRLKGHE